MYYAVLCALCMMVEWGRPIEQAQPFYAMDKFLYKYNSMEEIVIMHPNYPKLLIFDKFL